MLRLRFWCERRQKVRRPGQWEGKNSRLSHRCSKLKVLFCCHFIRQAHDAPDHLIYTIPTLGRLHKRRCPPLAELEVMAFEEDQAPCELIAHGSDRARHQALCGDRSDEHPEHHLNLDHDHATICDDDMRRLWATEDDRNELFKQSDDTSEYIRRHIVGIPLEVAQNGFTCFQRHIFRKDLSLRARVAGLHYY